MHDSFCFKESNKSFHTMLYIGSYISVNKDFALYIACLCRLYVASYILCLCHKDVNYSSF